MTQPDLDRRRLARHALVMSSAAALAGCATDTALPGNEPFVAATRQNKPHAASAVVGSAVDKKPPVEPACYSACQLPGGAMGVAHIIGTRIAWQTPLPQRVHDIVTVPARDLVCAVARRHGAHAWLLSQRDGRVVDRIDAPAGQHFSGHAAVYGQYLYTTENDHNKGRGVVVVRDLDNLQVVAVWSSGGIGPHQLLTDPQREQLYVANGGRLTNPAYPDQLLNAGAINANLATLNLHTGTISHVSYLAESRLSIRHLAHSTDGTLLVAQQASGAPSGRHKQWPLLAERVRGETLTPCAIDPVARRHLLGYVGSVAISPDGQYGCATSPRAGHALIWSLQNGSEHQVVPLTDVSGAGFCSNTRLLLSTGTGHVHTYQYAGARWHNMHAQEFAGYRWDNHLSVAQ